jgi:hypothetical protein
MDRSLFINTLTGKRIPMVRILLAIKENLTSTSAFYLFLIILKFLGLIILHLSFVPDATTHGYKLPTLLRQITTFNFIGTSATYSSYALLSYLTFLILLIFIGVYVYVLRQTKRKEDFIVTFKARVFSVILSVIFHVLLVLGQHIIELFSFIYVIQFNSGILISQNLNQNLLDLKNGNFALFFNTSLSADSYILVLINTLGIILINFFFFYALKIVNEPFFDTEFPVQMKLSGFSVLFYMIITNLQALHYVELFITDLTTVKVFKYFIFGILNGLLLLGFARSYNSFNYNNSLAKLVYFLASFAFFSSILELSLSWTENPTEDFEQMLFILICKILITVSFTILTTYLNEKMFLSRLKTSLFQQYDGRASKSDLESLFYLINLLINLKDDKVDELSHLMNIILTHKTECVVDYCKCNNINEYKTEKLVHEINLILEGIFVNLNLGKENEINLVFSEYLFYMRKSTLFSWAIMNTFVSKNVGIKSSIEIYQFFLLLFKKVCQHDDMMKATDHYIHFYEVFREIQVSNFYMKKMNKFIDNFENFVSFKEKFDNSIKVDHAEGRIDSYVFQTSMSHLVDTCRNHQMFYRKMKSYIRKDFSINRCKSTELSYKLFAFFQIFNKKAPAGLLNMVCIDSTVDMSSANQAQQFFNQVFAKFFTDKKSALNIIIEINKMFKIKYVNHKLCKALGHSYNKIINDDVHALFPLQLREPHKKVLLNHFLIQRNLTFIKRSFAFTATNNIVPLDLYVSCFPSLKKNLQAVISVYPIEGKDDGRTFFFVLTEFYELIGISENLDELYSINFELIDKLNINMLKLFDMVDLIPTKFKVQLDDIKRERRMKHLDHLYSLSYFLFNLNNGDDSAGPAAPENENEKAAINGENQVGKSGNKQNSKYKVEPKTTYQSKLRGTGIQSLNKVGTIINNDNPDSSRSGNLLNTLTPGGVSLNLNNLNNLNNENGPASNRSKGNAPGTPTKGKSPYNNYNSSSGSKINNDGKNNNYTPTPNENTGSHSHTGGNNKNSTDHIITVLRDKKSVLENFEKIKNTCRDWELGFKYYDRLCQVCSKLRVSMGLSDGKTPNPNNENKTNFIREKLISKYNQEQEKKTSYSENFSIKIHFRKINDAPFFLVSVKEKVVYKAEKKAPSKIPGMKIPLKKDLTVVGEKAEEYNRFTTEKTITGNSATNTNNNTANSNSTPGNALGFRFRNKLTKTLKLKEEKNTENSEGNNTEGTNSDNVTPGNIFKSLRTSIKKGVTTMNKNAIENGEANNENNTANATAKPSDALDLNNILLPPNKRRGNKNNSSSSSSDKANATLEAEAKNKQEKIQKNERTSELITTIILGIFLLLNLGIAILVFDFKLFVLNTTKDFYKIEFWSKQHEASLLSLHSGLISYMMVLSGLTTFKTKYLTSIGKEVPLTDFNYIIEERANIHRDNFAKFFTATKASQYELVELENLLYTKKEIYDKLLLTWDAIPDEETFVGTVDYACSNSRSLSLEENFEGLIKDLENGFLLKKYTSLKNVNINSKHTRLFYFLNQNILKFETRLREFSNAIDNSEEEFINTWRKMTSILEIVNIFLSLILIFIIHYTLGKFDNSLFRILLSMFLNMSKGKKANFKATFECQLMKLKMKNFRTVLHTFLVENIKDLDECLNIDEYGVSKLLFKSSMRIDNGGQFMFNGAVANIMGLGGTVNVNNDQSLNGSALGLNSSTTPLALSGGMKTGKTEMVSLINNKKDNSSTQDQDKINNNFDGNNSSLTGARGSVLGMGNLADDGQLNSNPDKLNDPNGLRQSSTTKKRERDGKEKSTNANKRKGKGQDEKEETESFITNGQILKRTKHYSIQFVKVAKVLITLIFLIYIIFIVSNVVTNTMYLSNIDSNMALVSSFIMKFPAATRLYNYIRLMILSNDVSYVADYPSYMNIYDLADKNGEILYDQYQTALPAAYTFYDNMNSQDFAARAAEICTEGIQKVICNLVLKKENGYNKEGIKIASTTVIQTLNNIHKDYLKLYESGNTSLMKNLATKETVLRYFYSEEFANANIEMEYILEHSVYGFFEAVDNDMTTLFDFVINLDLLLGISSICLNIIIILYLIFGFFSRLKQSMSYISYSAKKFNRALFEN